MYNNFWHELYHSGVKGMKWGVRNGPPYPIEDRVFISGSSKTQTKDSGYYRKKLPAEISKKIDEYVKDKKRIIVGDAPGIDSQVQTYLSNKKYNKVTIYTTEKQPRFYANKDLGWKVKRIKSNETDMKKRLVAKDIAMTNDATEALAVILDNGATATRNNVERLRQKGKEALIFQLNISGKDDWT